MSVSVYSSDGKKSVYLDDVASIPAWRKFCQWADGLDPDGELAPIGEFCEACWRDEPAELEKAIRLAIERTDGGIQETLYHLLYAVESRPKTSVLIRVQAGE